MNNEDLEKTKSLSDLSDLIAKETEDVLPKNSDTLEDDILKNLEEPKEDVYNDLITHDIELATRTKEIEESKKFKKENLIDKFKKLPKKTKALIIGLVVAVILLIVIVLVIVLTHKKPQDEPTPEEPSIVIDNGNYRYEDGTLKFLNESNTQIGSYECNNKEEDKCYVAYLDNNEDDLNVSKNMYESNELINIRSSIYHNRYVFIVDSMDDKPAIKLYDMLENNVIGEYFGVKAYDTDKSDYVVLKDKSNKYGLYEISSNEVKTIIEPSYQYMGIIKKDTNDKIIVKKSSGYYLIDYNNKTLTKLINRPIYDYNEDYIVVKDNNSYSVVNYDGTEVLSKYDYVSLINKEYVAVVVDHNLYIRDYSNHKFNETGYQLSNEYYSGISIYSEDGLLKSTNYAYKVSINNDNATIYVKNEDKVEENGLNLKDGLASINIAHYSYLNGVLYFYKDDDKTEVLGSYACSNKNDLSTNSNLSTCMVANDNTSDNNFKNHTNTEYLLPVVASRYVFIRDNMDTNASEVKLYDLKDNKTVATYSTVSANILNNDNTLTFYDNEIKIIVKNKSNKYGLISLNSNGITKIYDFIYDSMERFGENYLVSSNGEYKVLYSSDSASLGYSGKIYDISGNYVVVKEHDKFYLYKTDGSKVSDTGYKMIKLLGNTCYSYIDDSNTLIISTYDNTRVSTGFVISDTTNEFDLYNRYSLSNVSGSVLVNVFDSNNNRIHNETYDLKKNNEEKTE